MTREEVNKRRASRCRHFNGAMNEKCKADVGYPPVDRLPCFGEKSDSTCVTYSPLSAEELAAKDAESERHIDLLRRGLSSCCEDPFDTGQVITSGRFKNHGPRFCSKCRKLCFMV